VLTTALHMAKNSHLENLVGHAAEDPMKKQTIVIPSEEREKILEAMAIKARRSWTDALLAISTLASMNAMHYTILRNSEILILAIES
jgi:hypothetical protein